MSLHCHFLDRANIDYSPINAALRHNLDHMAAALLSPVSLGLCTFNRGRAITVTLEAITAMCTHPDVASRIAEFIIIDNNCTDETPSLIDDFGRAHPALRVRRIVEPIQGIAAARARFFRESASPLLAMLDDDTLPDFNWLAAILSPFDTDLRAGWVGGRIELLFDSPPSGLARRYATMLAQQDFGPVSTILSRPDQGMASAAFAMRREALIATDWLNQRLLGGRSGAALESGEDYELCIRMRALGWNVRYTPEAKVRHLIPDRRQSIEYLERLARGVSLSKAQLKWLASGQPGPEWATSHLRTARTRLLRAKLLEWRPQVRRMKLAEHHARVESWERLLATLTAPDASAARLAHTP
jgi:cellulose synthase/poly-beta-1,6-N-acetylglucosamine synthase-like glycosyltransferase